MKKIDKKQKKQWKTPFLKELNTKLTLGITGGGPDAAAGEGDSNTTDSF